ncbi:MAG TPA: hypothetical protein VNI20_09125 [Fimbriimonadaceae bacterium]|nr:hypothetical protein [Fimbriimonadaceae bacterium]
MTYDDVVKIALALPGTEEGIAYRAPCVKREGKFMLAPKKDGVTMAVKLDWATHDRLLEEHPDVFYKTPHYDGYAAFLVRLPKLTKKVAQELVTASWENAPKPSTRRRAQ